MVNAEISAVTEVGTEKRPCCQERFSVDDKSQSAHRRPITPEKSACVYHIERQKKDGHGLFAKARQR